MSTSEFDWAEEYSEIWTNHGVDRRRKRLLKWEYAEPTWVAELSDEDLVHYCVLAEGYAKGNIQRWANSFIMKAVERLGEYWVIQSPERHREHLLSESRDGRYIASLDDSRLLYHVLMSYEQATVEDVLSCELNLPFMSQQVLELSNGTSESDVCFQRSLKSLAPWMAASRRKSRQLRLCKEFGWRADTFAERATTQLQASPGNQRDLTLNSKQEPPLETEVLEVVAQDVEAVERGCTRESSSQLLPIDVAPLVQCTDGQQQALPNSAERVSGRYADSTQDVDVDALSHFESSVGSGDAAPLATPVPVDVTSSADVSSVTPVSDSIVTGKVLPATSVCDESLAGHAGLDGSVVLVNDCGQMRNLEFAVDVKDIVDDICQSVKVPLSTDECAVQLHDNFYAAQRDNPTLQAACQLAAPGNFESFVCSTDRLLSEDTSECVLRLQQSLELEQQQRQQLFTRFRCEAIQQWLWHRQQLSVLSLATLQRVESRRDEHAAPRQQELNCVSMGVKTELGRLNSRFLIDGLFEKVASPWGPSAVCVGGCVAVDHSSVNGFVTSSKVGFMLGISLGGCVARRGFGFVLRRRFKGRWRSWNWQKKNRNKWALRHGRRYNCYKWALLRGRTKRRRKKLRKWASWRKKNKSYRYVACGSTAAVVFSTPRQLSNCSRDSPARTCLGRGTEWCCFSCLTVHA